MVYWCAWCIGFQVQLPEEGGIHWASQFGGSIFWPDPTAICSKLPACSYMIEDSPADRMAVTKETHLVEITLK